MTKKGLKVTCSDEDSHVLIGVLVSEGVHLVKLTKQYTHDLCILLCIIIVRMENQEEAESQSAETSFEFFFVCVCVSHPQHREVPRPGVEWEL